MRGYAVLQPIGPNCILPALETFYSQMGPFHIRPWVEARSSPILANRHRPFRGDQGMGSRGPECSLQASMGVRGTVVSAHDEWYVALWLGRCGEADCYAFSIQNNHDVCEVFSAQAGGDAATLCHATSKN